MLAVLLAAIAIVVCSVAIGQGICVLGGRREWAWWAPGAGFAALLMLAAVLIRLPGRSATTAAGIVLATVAALLSRDVRRALVSALPDGLPVVGIALAASVIPFLVYRRTGILGEGVNNDPGSHLATAWWLEHRQGPAAVGAHGGAIAKVGYPLGAHGLMAALALAKISLEHAWNGLIISLAPLTALVALGALQHAARAARWVAALLVALCYLAVSFQAQASFKETMEALLILAVALGTWDVLRGPERAIRWRAGIPVGVAIAGAGYVYSYKGFVWTVATAGAVMLASGRIRAAVVALPGALLGAVVIAAPSIGQFVTFSSSVFNHENGPGNLLHPLSVFEALGIWFGYDFRWTPDPLWPTAIGIALALAAGAVALWRLLRAGDYALPAALVPTLLIYAWTAATKNVYLSAKALTLAAPLIALTIAAGLLMGARGRAAGLAVGTLAVIVALGAGFSSFLVLRDTRVGPDVHRSELAQFRPAIGHEPVLFMPKNDLVEWDLVGLDLWTARDFYAPQSVTPRAARPNIPLGFVDFDSFTPATLDRFRYAITTNTPYQSAPPANWRRVAQTRSYVLWRRSGRTPERYAVDFFSTPGRVLDCQSKLGKLRLAGAAGGYALVLPRPVTGILTKWRGQTGDAGESATMTLEVPRGEWDLSLAYAAMTGLKLEAGSLRTTMPATIDRVGPYYYAGTLVQPRSGPVRITATANELGWFGRLIGAHGHTRGLDTPSAVPLGGVALTPHGQKGRRVPVRQACGRYVDHVVPPA